MVQNETNKILLVEDNLLNQQLTKSILSREGYETDIAENGQIGVDLYKKNHYRVVLMDIQMPVMDGMQATRLIREFELRNKKNKSLIIAVTAFAKESDKHKLEDAGMDHYLRKPFNPNDLISLINQRSVEEIES